MSAQPTHGTSLYGSARNPPRAHPAPNNAGLVLLLVVAVTIVAVVAVVGPELMSQLREMVDCVSHSQNVC